MLSIAVLGTSLSKAEDILLDWTHPIIFDRAITVATYYRNQPKFYYFTMVFKDQKDEFSRYRTKISFSVANAGIAHAELEKWTKKAHFQAMLYNDGELELEKKEIIPYFRPFKPRKKEEKKQEEVYILYPGSHYEVINNK